jgi:hypothetical protein
MSVVDATALVERYRQRVVALLGCEAEAAVVGCAPCQGRGGELAADGRFYVQGNYRVPVAVGTHIATLGRLRGTWIGEGYELTDFRTFAGRDEATVDVRNPDDGVQISLISSRPPTAVQVIIVTPCLRSPGDGYRA